MPFLDEKVDKVEEVWEGHQRTLYDMGIQAERE